MFPVPEGLPPPWFQNAQTFHLHQHYSKFRRCVFMRLGHTGMQLQVPSCTLIDSAALPGSLKPGRAMQSAPQSTSTHDAEANGTVATWHVTISQLLLLFPTQTSKAQPPLNTAECKPCMPELDRRPSHGAVTLHRSGFACMLQLLLTRRKACTTIQQSCEPPVAWAGAQRARSAAMPLQLHAVAAAHARS